VRVDTGFWGTGARRLLLLLPGLVIALAANPAAGGSQVIPDTLPPPPDTLVSPADTIPPDTIRSDTIPPVRDTIPPRSDSLSLAGMDPDSLEAFRQRQDSLIADSIAAADTLPAIQLPELAEVLPQGFETGVWRWDREAILGSKAITLAELVAEVPGTVLLRGGDYGTPVSVSAFGAGGERIRVFRDGMEVLPLEGSTPDLARVGLGGLQSVRVVRGIGELRIELETLLVEGGRPYSLIEAGTGDLNTNQFRGTFSHPRALGGALALAIERVDTQGPFGQEPGASTGGWVRFARGIGSRGALMVDYTKRSSTRGDLFSPKSAGRSDWSVRTRWELPRGLVGDLFYASSQLDTDEDVGFDFGTEPRTRAGAILSYDSPWVRGFGRLQRLTGDGLPQKSAFLELSGALPSIGGVAGEAEWEDWGGETATRTRLHAWTEPLWGLSLFAERGSGSWGLPYLPPAPVQAPDPDQGDSGDGTEPPEPEPPVLPGPRFTDSEGTRIGLSYQWRGFQLSGARLNVTTDSLFLLGLPMDRTGVTVDETFFPSATLPGGTRDGFEVSARIPLYPRGFALLGSYQRWDQAEDVWTTPADSLGSPEPLPEAEVPWRYLPRENYQGSLSFHNTFLPTGNLELWFDLGVSGRSSMAVPFLQEVNLGGEEPVTRQLPMTVPFYQNWFVRLQIRVVTVRVFFMWENFSTRQRNQDFPGRVLIPSRSLYGVRWTMWN